MNYRNGEVLETLLAEQCFGSRLCLSLINFNIDSFIQVGEDIRDNIMNHNKYEVVVKDDLQWNEIKRQWNEISDLELEMPMTKM